MGVFALLNEYLVINSVNLSSKVKAATLTIEADNLDPTTMGDTWKEALAGVKSFQLQVEFTNDYAGSSVDDTLWGLFGTVPTFEVRPDAGAVSATNPKFTGSVLINQHAVGGSHGELNMLSVTYPGSGTLTRATS